jgi:hypothetical protein
MECEWNYCVLYVQVNVTVIKHEWHIDCQVGVRG